MLCRELELILENEGFSPIPEEARAHVAACDSCRDLIADFAAIAGVAREIPAEIEPPARIWISLRAQLEAEGIIRNRDVVVAQPSSWRTRSTDLFRARVAAFAAAGLAIATAILLQMPPQIRYAGEIASAGARQSLAATAAALQQQERDITNVQVTSPAKVDSSLKQSLEMVDQFIQDCEQRVNAEPQDELARDYLFGAYQQKADLLAAMMERGGNGN